MDEWLLFGFVCVSVLMLIILQKRPSSHTARSGANADAHKGLNTHEQAFLLRLQQALPTESILIQGKRFLIQSPHQETLLIFIFRHEKPAGCDYRQEGELTVVIYKDTGSIDQIVADWQQYRKSSQTQT